ncbi:MAG: DUF948 domain-containing protein [Candidatus Geothermincolia bacterium]
MNVLKAIFYLLLIVLTPVVSVFLIRLAMKASKAVDRLARTLDDARPQVNILLQEADRSLERAVGELDKVTIMTGQAMDVARNVEGAAMRLQRAIGSPWLRYGIVVAGFALYMRRRY